MYEIYESNRQFDKNYPSWAQDEALKRLLWYLNSGKRRLWAVVERPDRVERNKRCPDYVCQEKHSGEYITVEITRICVPPKRMEVEAFLDKLGYEVAKRVAGKLRGTYILATYNTLNLKGTPISNFADKLADEILPSASNLAAPYDSKMLSSGLRLRKLQDEGAELFPGIASGENMPEINLVNDSQIIAAIRAAVAEANVKLRNYHKGTRILLLTHDVMLDYVDFFDILDIPKSLPKNHTKFIDKCYALRDVPGLFRNVMRLW